MMKHIEDLQRLVTASDAITGKRTAALTALSMIKQQAVDAAAAVKDREAEEVSLVSAETIKDGLSTKLAYSNAAARGAEVRKRLKADAGYQRLQDAERTIQQDRSNAEIALTRLDDEEKSLTRQFEAVGLALRAEIARGLEQAIREFTIAEARRFAQEDKS